LSRPFPSRSPSSTGPFVRVNGKIRAREVRVIGVDGKQHGVLPLGDALQLARISGVDLVEVAPSAVPPVCRVVDFGKYRYEQAKRDKESKKHQHANKVKEVQLSPKIDPHDLGVKIQHAVDFLCEDMKVKVNLKFRGREMAHTEFGFLVVRKFLDQIAPFGPADFQPKLAGRNINVMVSPLPRNKRAKNPSEKEEKAFSAGDRSGNGSSEHRDAEPVKIDRGARPEPDAASNPDNFVNNPFAQLEVKG